MSDTYIIEVRSEPAGIIVKDKKGFRFFAASVDFKSLEGSYFRNAREAEDAAIRSANDRRSQSMAKLSA